MFTDHRGVHTEAEGVLAKRDLDVRMLAAFAGHGPARKSVTLPGDTVLTVP
ncbi:MAG TPA: hypothetical protein VMU34_12875 [Mycobacterium sp.]|nr:hypothetical protein [Mycobacterium sp.]